MKLMRWQPMTEVMELSRLLERSLDSSKTERQGKLKLSLDVFETEDALTLRASLPGAQKDDIRVELEDQVLTVTAELKQPELPDGAKSLLQESQFGLVSRTLRIPHRLNLESTKGTFTDGVLQVVFSKAPEARKTTITIE